jgi:hypothetical protein
MSQSIKDKQAKVIELGKRIDLHAEVLPMQTRGRIGELQDRLTFRLQELTEECRERELDMKIEAMQEVLNILNQKK